MTGRLPTDDDVRTAMNLVIQEASDARRRPTITAVERQLGITHPTFYRNFPDLISWFKEQIEVKQATTTPDPVNAPIDPAAQMANLRRENEDLRRRARIYAEAVRQLTLDNATLQSALNAQAQVTDLETHRRQRTTDTNERPS